MGYRAGILLRLSEEKDTEELTAEFFERSEAVCRQRIETEGWTFTEMFNEGVASAYKSNRHRKVFESAMRALETGAIDKLVVPYVDRFTRGYAEPARAERAMAASDGDIVDSTGRSARYDESWHIMVGVAIAESARIARRVRNQVEQAVEKGRPQQGPRSFGYEPGGKVVRESEASVIREVTRRLLTGEPMGAIVRDLREREIKGARGKLFTATSLRAIITNPRIAAIRVHRGQEVSGKWPEIISEADHRAVRRIFDARSDKAREAEGLASYRPGRGRGTGRGYAYSGLLVCSFCNGRLAGSSGAYRCQACRRTYVQADRFEAVMDRVIIRKITSPEFAANVSRKLAAWREGDTTAEDLKRDQADLADLEATPASVLALVPNGAARKAELQSRVRDAEARLASMPEIAVLLDTPTTETELRAAWSSWTVEQRRARLAAVVSSITIRPATRRRVFDVSRIEEPAWK